MSELEPTRTYSNHTATDELRRLLDERGVEWQDFDDEPTWMGSDGEMHYARQEFTFNGLTDNVTVYRLTPEQAVEATLGRGTCRMEPFIYEDTGAFIECSECGWQLFDADYSIDAAHEWLGYCPNCGAKVVDA